jgi:hypothetical protein
LATKTQKLLTTHGQHHPQADADHLYVARKQEGRGLIQLQKACILEIMQIIKYVDSMEDPLI